MKKVAISIAATVGLIGSAQATFFNTLTIGAFDGVGSPSFTPTFTTLNNTYSVAFTGLTVASPRDFLDVQWTHTFDTTQSVVNSPASAPFFSVTQTLTGQVRRTSGTGAVQVDASLTESITDEFGAPFGTGGNFGSFSSSTGSAWVPFSFSLTTPFTAPLSKGAAIKDNLVIRVSADTEIEILGITQEFQAVPEPATMSVLAIGVVTALRRKRK